MTLKEMFSAILNKQTVYSGSLIIRTQGDELTITNYASPQLVITLYANPKEFEIHERTNTDRF